MRALGLIFLFLPLFSLGQIEYAQQTFKDTRVVNGHSVETNVKGEAKFIISHRFGAVSDGLYEFFGIDQATMRIGLDYGFTNNLLAGFGRSSFEKTFDGYVKYKILKQSTGEKKMPLTLTGLATVAIDGQRWADPERENYFSSRMDYTFQILAARKFSDAFSFQLMPTLVHRNLVPADSIAHDVLSLGAATRWQITKQVSLQAEYYYTPEGQLADEFTNSLSLGVDIETKGHVFQLHISNSRGMTEKFFVTETRGDISKGELHLGFNITRDFRIRGRK